MVELTDIPSSDEVSDNWSDNVVYKGINVYMAAYYRPADSWNYALEHLLYGMGISEYQECYLGYEPESDTFIMAFDIFDDEEKRNTTPNIFKFAVENNIISSITHQNILGNMFYSDKQYEVLHQRYPNLIDVRLD